MAGICGYVAVPHHIPPPKDLLANTLVSMIPLVGARSVTIPVEENHIALGGLFPMHFQRRANFMSRNGKVLLFYGELYDVPAPPDEAERAFHVLESEGIAGLADLNGAFALMWWDGRTLMGACDRFGRIPLYVMSGPGFSACTTDLYACHAAGVSQPSLCRESLVDLLSIGFCLGEKSMFEGVSRISGGEYCTISHDTRSRGRYSKLSYAGEPAPMEEMVDVFAACTKRAVYRKERPVVALTGGWDSRATWASLKEDRRRGDAMTYGERDSTDVAIASRVAERLDLTHVILEPDDEWFPRFPEIARKALALGNGHTRADFAFQLFVLEKLVENHYDVLVDSAGCEFRRGMRAKLAADNLQDASGLAGYLLSLYSTGIWNPGCISPSFYVEHRDSTRERLTAWLQEMPCASSHERIDQFSLLELWGHHYAHGYALGTNLLSCHLPYYDREFIDLFAQSGRQVRWSNRFHRATVALHAPELQHIPLSFGHCKTPYPGSWLRYAPLLYHKLVTLTGASKWWKQIDNYRPYFPFRQWYREKLGPYVLDMVHSDPVRSSGILNTEGVEACWKMQNRSAYDFSGQLNIILTLGHLLEYAGNMNPIESSV